MSCYIDFDPKLVIEERTELVAKKITEFLKYTNRFDRTIVLCVDIEGAAPYPDKELGNEEKLVALAPPEEENPHYRQDCEV